MSIEQLRRVYQARPFRAFTIYLADGQSIPVVSPEFMALSATGRTVLVYHGNDAFDVIDPLLVTRLELKESESPRRRRQA
jgi:hypothetical protein